MPSAGWCAGCASGPSPCPPCSLTRVPVRPAEGSRCRLLHPALGLAHSRGRSLGELTLRITTGIAAVVAELFSCRSVSQPLSPAGMIQQNGRDGGRRCISHGLLIGRAITSSPLPLDSRRILPAKLFDGQPCAEPGSSVAHQNKALATLGQRCDLPWMQYRQMRALRQN